MRMTVAPVLFAVFVSVLVASQEPSDPVALNAEAMKAYRTKNYAGFLAYEKRALELDSNNPRLLYNVACGESLQGNAHEAVRLLELLADRKLDLGAETGDDFSAIHNTPEWARFTSKLAELRKPTIRSQVAFRLADPALVATGIAVDPGTGATYIASARERKIVCRTKDGAVADFISEAQDGFLGGDSLAIDSPRRPSCLLARRRLLSWSVIARRTLEDPGFSSSISSPGSSCGKLSCPPTASGIS